jgi:hypothetical protein
MIRYVILFMGVLILGCKPSSQTTTTQGGKYHEDLSAYRPKTEEQKQEEIKSDNVPNRDPKQYVEAQNTVTAQLHAVLDSIDRINLTKKFVDGYTIQIYSGLKREDALNAKKELTMKLPEIESVLQYVQPNFRVKAGKYLSQLDAQKDLTSIKKYFPTAILVPDKIGIN